MTTFSMSLTFAKTAFLHAIKNPEWVDGGPGLPGPPQFSEAATHYMLASVIRDISKNLNDRAIAEQLYAVGEGMAHAAASGLVAGWQEGDDICPPWWPWWRGPWPRPNWLSGPVPDPWFERASPRAQDVVMATVLLEIAALTPERGVRRSAPGYGQAARCVRPGAD